MTKLQTNKQVIVRTIAIRKPVLSRQMHLRINNRAWLKEAMSRPIIIRRSRDDCMPKES